MSPYVVSSCEVAVDIFDLFTMIGADSVEDTAVGNVDRITAELFAIGDFPVLRSFKYRLVCLLYTSDAADE